MRGFLLINGFLRLRSIPESVAFIWHLCSRHSMKNTSSVIVHSIPSSILIKGWLVHAVIIGIVHGDCFLRQVTQIVGSICNMAKGMG